MARLPRNVASSRSGIRSESRASVHWRSLRVQIGIRVVARLIQGSCAVHRDNPVFEFAPESPGIGRHGDVVRIVRVTPVDG